MSDARRRLRIAVIAACPFPYPRGTPVRIERLAEYLAREGNEVHVLTYPVGRGEPAPGIEVHRTRRIPGFRKLSPGPSPAKLLFADPLLTVTIARFLKSRGADVLYAHHYEGLGAALAGRALAGGEGRVPLVYDAHTLLFSELPYYGPGPLRALVEPLGRRLDRAIPPMADHVVCVSASIREFLIADARMRDDDVTVVTNGVETDTFAPPREVLERNGTPELVYAGTLAPYAGIDLMLRAFGRVREARADVRLVIASGSDFDAYEPLARSLGVREAIDLVSGSFDRLPSVLHRAEIALNPRPECAGIPMKLLNYMASAKPVVSFAASAPGVVHGETGWLVEGTDVPGFADGILHLLDHPELARDIGMNARRHTVTHHGWDTAARRIDGIFRRLVPGEVEARA